MTTMSMDLCNTNPYHIATASDEHQQTNRGTHHYEADEGDGAQHARGDLGEEGAEHLGVRGLRSIHS